PSQRIAQVGELVRGLRGALLAPRPAKPKVSREVVAAPSAAEVARPRVEPPKAPANRALPAAPPATAPYTPPISHVPHNPPGISTEEPESPPLLLAVAPSLWQRATRTARRAEPMALPALALLAVGGLAALLLIFAAMRVAGTLIARMAQEDAQA